MIFTPHLLRSHIARRAFPGEYIIWQNLQKHTRDTRFSSAACQILSTTFHLVSQERRSVGRELQCNAVMASCVVARTFLGCCWWSLTRSQTLPSRLPFLPYRLFLTPLRASSQHNTSWAWPPGCFQSLIKKKGDSGSTSLLACNANGLLWWCRTLCCWCPLTRSQTLPSPQAPHTLSSILPSLPRLSRLPGSPLRASSQDAPGTTPSTFRHSIEHLCLSL